ncbi:LAMI_0H05820g1_1 [Lachancea mirantina]|uniref:LAMI_0H05820g1_1 n=1 Tax=Lachancea mirantina TaxID=1230905 RepID=A0A1G4KFD7_9SACH|nr:LAMI_0H05820g1_1 [Lachancea mirantina]
MSPVATENPVLLGAEETFFESEVYPPIAYAPVASDLPPAKVYGNHAPHPQLISNDSQASKLVTKWIRDLNALLESDSPQWQDLFSEHAAWRDHLALSWDLHSYIGLDRIAQSAGPLAQKSRVRNVRIDPLADYRYPAGFGKVQFHDAPEDPVAHDAAPIEWIQVYFEFDNKVGSGKGVARLCAVQHPASLKCFTFYTVLEDLHASPETVFGNRPEGVNHGQHIQRESWAEKRARESHFGEKYGRQPTVLIVGGGQGGLTVAARLRQFGVDSLIVEKNKKIGDNWRNRYKFLVLHDPVWYDHLPYLNFPPTWPVYTPKDKLGDWFESYAKTLDLNVQSDAVVTDAAFDDAAGRWSVTVVDNATGEKVVYTPNHLVMATGHSGEPRVPQFENQNAFQGKIVHSSWHTSGSDFTGGKALVVGGCNSAHDICQDFYEQGVEVTMLQRSSTCVITSDHGTVNNIAGLYDETGPKTETADHIFHSMPLSLLNAVMQQQYRKSCREDKELLSALEKVGFKTNAGYDGTGLFGLYFRQGSGYYIDVGCSKLIAERKVKVKQGQGIKRFLPTGVEFTDGSKLEGLDVVVLATGFTNMKETARRLFGDKVADRLKEVWGLDHEGEFRTIWRDSGHPNFWYMGGNLAISRYYSKRLALRIVAQEKKLQY